jgi:hypothetical protein
VNEASVSSRNTPANAHANNRIIRSDTKRCCQTPTRARTIITATTSKTMTIAATMRTPVDATSSRTPSV